MSLLLNGVIYPSSRLRSTCMLSSCLLSAFNAEEIPKNSEGAESLLFFLGHHALTGTACVVNIPAVACCGRKSPCPIIIIIVA